MNWTKRDMLMQRLPAAADILAIVPMKERFIELTMTTYGGCWLYIVETSFSSKSIILKSSIPSSSILAKVFSLYESVFLFYKFHKNLQLL